MRILISVDGNSYEFEDTSADNIELMAIERVTGMTTAEWADAINRGSMLGTTALIWIMRRRAEPGLKFDDVHFHPASLKVETVEDDEPGKDVITT
jgi:hypothetical protein